MIESISIVNSGLAETVETSSIKEDVVLQGETLKEVAYSNYSVLKEHYLNFSRTTNHTLSG